MYTQKSRFDQLIEIEMKIVDVIYYVSTAVMRNISCSKKVMTNFLCCYYYNYLETVLSFTGFKIALKTRKALRSLYCCFTNELRIPLSS
jgi:hypothetical protein